MALTAILLAACDSGSTPAGQAPPPPTAGAPIQVELPVTELVVGDDRIPIGLVQQNSPVTDATVTVRIYRMEAGGPQLRAEVPAPFKGEGLEGGGLYVARSRLDRKGQWFAQVLARRPDGSTADVTRALNVVDTPRIPAVGQAAPQSRNLTARDVPDLSYIDSGQPPDDMHELSIADAVRTHRPALVVFATPAFCQSATCGPEIHAVQAVEPEFRDRVSFIHVEIYRDYKPDPSKRTLSPTVLEWNLQTEPWVFLIDRTGVIRARFEGPTASDEIREGLTRLLASG